MLDQLHEEMEKTVAELDAEEAKQMTELAQSFLENFTSSTGEVDEQFANQLVEEGSVNEDDVSKIIKLHKAEMKEYRREYETSLLNIKTFYSLCVVWFIVLNFLQEI